MKVLLTGGAGYIGLHTAIELLESGHEVVLLDNFSNAAPGAVAALAEVVNRAVPFVRGDVRDEDVLDGVFGDGGFDAVMHFAAFKAVGESVENPLRYYGNNAAGTVCLLERMAAHGVRTLIFSSSATVYRESPKLLAETRPTVPSSPYGRTKLFEEEMLRDLHAADPQWRISILRYFNAVGAHLSGLVGEDPTRKSGNLLPCICRIALGRGERQLEVFGDDYPTPDGTCVRDYLHVMDLAGAHVAALNFLAPEPRIALHNLGTGRGHSVLDVIRAFERASGQAIPYRIVARRAGDAAISCANPSRAETDLGWTATRGLDRICADQWRFLSSRPNGYPNCGPGVAEAMPSEERAAEPAFGGALRA